MMEAVSRLYGAKFQKTATFILVATTIGAEVSFEYIVAKTGSEVIVESH